MCVYCALADHTFRFDPPWQQNPYQPLTQPFGPLGPPFQQPPWHQNIPPPAQPLPDTYKPWEHKRLKEFQEILERIEKIEKQLDCDCVEPEKPDYIKLIKDRLDQLEEKIYKSNT